MGRGGVKVIEFTPLRLNIWTVRPADIRPFVPPNPEPAHIGHQRVGRTFNRSLFIGIFDTQNKLPPMLFRIQVAKKCSASTTNMKVAGRAGGKSSSYSHGRKRKTRPVYKTGLVYGVEIYFKS